MGGKSVPAGLLVALSAVILAVAAMLNPGVGSAATALIMGATNNSHPSDEYVQKVGQYYLDQTTECKVGTCALTAVVTPEQLWPVTGWDDLQYDKSIAIGQEILHSAILAQLAATPSDTVVVYGSSQSADIITLEKRLLADQPESVKDRVVFVVTANPNRPNGGLLQRFAPFTIPDMGFTFNGATPTDTGIQTIDIVFQYDAAADFPRYPLNIFTLANIVAGAAIHSSYVGSLNGYTEEELQQAINDPANRQTYGDTVYVTIPAKSLPLADLIRAWGTATGSTATTTPLADLLEPTLRVLVDLGYDRTTPYGEPTQVGVFPTIEPIKLANDLIKAAQEGIEAASADLRANPPRTTTVQTPSKTTAEPLNAGAQGSAARTRSPAHTAKPKTTTPTAAATSGSTTPGANTTPSGARPAATGGPRRSVKSH